MKNIWKYYDEQNSKIDSSKIAQIELLQKEYNINRLLATIMVNRGISPELARVFLNPNRYDFYDPYLIEDMDIAVDRIINAINNNEKVIIYGDYDVDGITSTTVLKSFLNDRGLEVATYIPNRLSEGYGLNLGAIKKIALENYNLIITVDCGITSIKEVDLAKENNIDVIVTDHHEPGDSIPNALAVVDCKRKENQYPFRELAGVGVVFKLCQAISHRLNLDEKEYLKYLDIVSIGTIADVVPLVDENRVITSLGLKLINCTKNMGLKAILDDIGYKNIDSMAIAFGVAPRINACGRMGESNLALQLFLTNNQDEALNIAMQMKAYNLQRQSEEKRIFEDAILKIEQNNYQDDSAIVLGGNNWHNGVIGIVSSRITEKYYKPSILVCFKDDDELGKGSGRSIKGFDLHEALMYCKDTLNAFGGHTMAAGLAVTKQKFDDFRKSFLDFSNKANIKDLKPIINIDEDVNIDDINISIVQSLKLLEPFGEANIRPVFKFSNLKIDNIRTLTDGKHLKLVLKSEKNIYVNAIGFNLGELFKYYTIGDIIDVVGNLEINSYNGMDSIQINIKDVRKNI